LPFTVDLFTSLCIMKIAMSENNKEKQYPSEINTVAIVSRVPVETAESVRHMAESEGKTRSKFIAELLEEAVKDEQHTV
jgi:hypothetical protein